MGRIISFSIILLLFLSSCNEILIGDMEEGDPVQLNVEIYNPASESEAGKTKLSTENPVVDQLKLRLARVSVGNGSVDDFSFILRDSVFELSEKGESSYMAEKVLPEGGYKDLQLFLGDTEDFPEEGTTTASLTGTLELTGVYNNTDFVINSSDPISLELEFDPLLEVSKNTGMLRIITLYFDSSVWFTGPDQTGFTDPTDSTTSEQIVENILASAGLKKSMTEHDPSFASFGMYNPYQLGIKNADAEETDGVLAFKVKLSQPSDQEIEVDYITSNINAAADEDYEAVYGTLAFSPGETEHTVEVPILDDALSESDEKFFIRLLNPVHAVVRPNDKKAMGTIYDDEKFSDRMLICHYPPVENQSVPPQTMRIKDTQWPAHQAHGDTIGTCSE